MSGAPVCSVVIPAYNCEGYIGDCLRSVLEQTVRDIEVIVVDDRSTDATAERVLALGEADGRVRCIRHEANLGVAEARNSGVREARSEWIAFLDGDDMWLPRKLEKQLAFRDKTGAGLVYTAAACMAGDGSPLERSFPAPPSVTYEELLKGNDIVCSSVLVRRSALLRRPMERSDLHEDYICWLRLLKDGVLAAGLDEPLVRYRFTENSKSRGKLASARTTWKTYTYLGIPAARRLALFAAYALHGVKRYCR